MVKSCVWCAQEISFLKCRVVRHDSFFYHRECFEKAKQVLEGGVAKMAVAVQRTVGSPSRGMPAALERECRYAVECAIAGPLGGWTIRRVLHGVQVPTYRLLPRKEDGSAKLEICRIWQGSTDTEIVAGLVRYEASHGEALLIKEENWTALLDLATVLWQKTGISRLDIISPSRSVALRRSPEGTWASFLPGE